MLCISISIMSFEKSKKFEINKNAGVQPDSTCCIFHYCSPFFCKYLHIAHASTRLNLPFNLKEMINISAMKSLYFYRQGEITIFLVHTKTKEFANVSFVGNSSFLELGGDALSQIKVLSKKPM